VSGEPVAIALYGPPASGKDTITTELQSLDSRYVAYQRLKVGQGKTAGYRVVAADVLQELEANGRVLYRNSRYGNVYAVDSGSLAELTGAGLIPVLHIGQVEGMSAVEAFPARWVRVLLWCGREITTERAATRGDRDVEDRLRVWDETYQDLCEHAEFEFDVLIRTDQVPAAEAARQVRAALGADVVRRSAREVI
jgi:guanylate kinase